MVELLSKNLVICSQLRFVESQQQVSCGHMHPIAHGDAGHDPASGMLDFFHIRFDDERAGQDHGAGQWHKSRPAAEESDTDDQHAKSTPELVLKVARQTNTQSGVCAVVRSVTSILAEKNPFPLAATFDVSSGGEGYVSTRIKMGQTSDVWAVVKAGGRFYTAKKEVKVTVGGCG